MKLFSKLLVIVIAILAILYIKDNFLSKFDFNNPLDSMSELFMNKENIKNFNKNSKEDPQDYNQYKENVFTQNNLQNNKTDYKNNIAKKKNTIYIYFLSIDKSSNIPMYHKIKREIKNENNKLESSINELLKGPTLKERQAGYYSEIPRGTKLLSIKQKNNSIIINLSSDFEYGGGTDSIYNRIKQLIKTINSTDCSKKIYLYLDGKQADVLGGEGIIINQPLDEKSLYE